MPFEPSIDAIPLRMAQRLGIRVPSMDRGVDPPDMSNFYYLLAEPGELLFWFRTNAAAVPADLEPMVTIFRRIAAAPMSFSAYCGDQLIM